MSRAFRDFSEAVVIDVETTGLEPESDRIVSIAALRLDFRESARTGQLAMKSFQARVNPGVPIPSNATAIHGLTDADVANADSFADIAEQLREFIGDCRLVGHNVGFDKRMLSNEYKRAGLKPLSRRKTHCTMHRLKEQLGKAGKGYRRLSLDQAVSRLGIGGRQSDKHDAMEDAMLAAQLAVAIYAEDNGIRLPSDEARDTRQLMVVGGAIVLGLIALAWLLL